MKEDSQEVDVSTKNLTDWDNEPTVADLKNDYNSASSSRDTQVGKIDNWLNMLNVDGAHKPKKREGRSGVQPKLVRKQAEWRYSALSEPFLNSDDVFAIAPKSYKDRQAAAQNEMVLNYQFNNQMDKVHLIDSYIRTAVNEGTVIARIGWAYEEDKVEEEQPVYKYEEADNFQAQTILNAQQLFMTNPEQFESLPEELKESVSASIENQRPIIATIKEYETVEVVKVVKNQPEVTVCNYQNITIDPTCDGDFDKANFIIYSFEASKSDLEKMGNYQNLDKIIVGSPGSDGFHHTDDAGFTFQDEPRKKMAVYEYWGYWDIDNSGITTPIVATWVGNTMIRMEANPFPDRKLPFVVVPYLPTKKSVYGEPDATLLEDNQKLIGALTRGMVDAMARSANGQVGMRKDALDTVNRRKFKQGLDYEFNPSVIPQNAIIEHSYPELPASTFNMLQMFNMDAEATTGVKSFSGGMSGDALGTTATGVRGLLDAASKRELNILRRLAQGMQEIGKKILAMNGEWLSDEEVIRVTDEEFVAINRDNLVGSFDIKLGISTAESDNIKAQELAFMLQTMGQVLPFDMTKIILSDIAKLRNMPELSKRIETYEPQPDPMQQIEMEKGQLENQKLQAELQETMANIQLTQAKIQSELAKARETGTKANLNDLNFVEQESGVTQEREKELQQAQAEGNLKRDITKSAFDTVMKQGQQNV